MNLEKVGLGLPEILLPKNGTDLTKWAVVGLRSIHIAA